MRGMRPQEELHWMMDTEERPAGLHCATPLEGPVTDLPHPELFAAEPSTGRHVVVIHPPLIPCDARSRMFCHWRGMLRHNPSIDRHCIRDHLMRTIPTSRLAFAVPRADSDASGIAPSSTELDDSSYETSESTEAPYNDYEDIVSVQFSSICSPFLATTHVPCSQAGHIRTTPH